MILLRTLSIILLLMTPPLMSFAGKFALTNVDPEQFQAEWLSVRDRKIVEIKFEGSELPPAVRDRFLELSNRPLSLNVIHKIINWYQESTGDARLETQVERLPSGVLLRVILTERAKINKIILDGVVSFPTSSLLSFLEIKDGSQIDAVALENSANKLAGYYGAQGYLQATVRTEMDSEKNLHFIVNEGPPTTIQSIEISPITGVSEARFRRRLESDLIATFGLRPGDSLVQERVAEGLLLLRGWLRAHDFLTATDPVVEKIKTESGLVQVKINIDYGSRIRFGFRKNQRFSHRELQSLISEVKEVSVGQDYVDAVKRKIIDAYKDVGLIDIKINTLVRDDPDRGIKYISLIIDEGKKVRIKNLYIDGLFSLTESERSQLFNSFAPRLVQRGYFHESGIQRAGELLADHLRSKGYVSAKLEFTRTDFSNDRKFVDVYLLFSEGVQTVVGQIRLSGFRSFKDDEVRKILKVEPGQPFNVFAFERGLVDLKDRYQDLGQLQMVILNENSEDIVSYNKPQTEASIHVEVDEGPTIKLGSIIIRGNTQTHSRVVTRELPVIPGDILTRPILKESEDNIRKLNLFSSVIVRPIEHPGTEDTRDLLILVEESTPGSVDLSPGFRNDLGLRAAAGVSYQNLGGWHRGASARAIVNRRISEYKAPEYNISFGFREPYFANWPVTFTSNLNFLRRQFNSFDANVSKITSGFRRDVTKSVALLIEYSYERSSLYNVRLPYDPSTDEKTNYIGAVTPGIIFDTRNDKFNPAEGVLLANRFEWAHHNFGSEKDVGYYRATSYNSFYTSIFDDLIAALAINAGYERSNVPGHSIPTLKTFRLGGIGSIRGYKEEGIEVETNTVIKGTLAFLNYRGELRFPVLGSLGGAMFLDAGNLFVDQIHRPWLLRSSAGLGFRYNTAVGPVSLDVAKKLQTESKVGDISINDVDRYRVHFSIGAF